MGAEGVAVAPGAVKKVRPAPDELPWCFEPGTQSHEGIAGVAAAVDHFAWIGETMAGGAAATAGSTGDRRRSLEAAMRCLFDYEQTLSARLVGGLQALPGVRVQGLTERKALARRVPTISFTHERVPPAELAQQLGERNISCGAGTTMRWRLQGRWAFSITAACCGSGSCITTARRSTRS